MPTALPYTASDRTNANLSGLLDKLRRFNAGDRGSLTASPGYSEAVDQRLGLPRVGNPAAASAMRLGFDPQAGLGGVGGQYVGNPEARMGLGGVPFSPTRSAGQISNILMDPRQRGGGGLPMVAGPPREGFTTMIGRPTPGGLSPEVAAQRQAAAGMRRDAARNELVGGTGMTRRQLVQQRGIMGAEARRARMGGLTVDERMQLALPGLAVERERGRTLRDVEQLRKRDDGDREFERSQDRLGILLPLLPQLIDSGVIDTGTANSLLRGALGDIVGPSKDAAGPAPASDGLTTPNLPSPAPTISPKRRRELAAMTPEEADDALRIQEGVLNPSERARQLENINPLPQQPRSGSVDRFVDSPIGNVLGFPAQGMVALADYLTGGSLINRPNVVGGPGLSLPGVPVGPSRVPSEQELIDQPGDTPAQRRAKAHFRNKYYGRKSASGLPNTTGVAY